MNPRTEAPKPSTISTPLFQRNSTLRRARFGDLAPAARSTSLAFWDDVLFGRIIHPRRNAFPSDFDKYFYRRFVVDWWDWSHVFLVTTETVKGEEGNRIVEREVITGLAHWSRISSSRQLNYDAGWELGWWDPSKCKLLIFLRISNAIFRFVQVAYQNGVQVML